MAFEACYLKVTPWQLAAKPIRSSLLVIDAPRSGRKGPGIGRPEASHVNGAREEG
jgi:hypothetical protein